MIGRDHFSHSKESDSSREMLNGKENHNENANSFSYMDENTFNHPYYAMMAASDSVSLSNNSSDFSKQNINVTQNTNPPQAKMVPAMHPHYPYIPPFQHHVPFYPYQNPASYFNPPFFYNYGNRFYPDMEIALRQSIIDEERRHQRLQSDQSMAQKLRIEEANNNALKLAIELSLKESSQDTRLPDLSQVQMNDDQSILSTTSEQLAFPVIYESNEHSTEEEGNVESDRPHRSQAIAELLQDGEDNPVHQNQSVDTLQDDTIESSGSNTNNVNENYPMQENPLSFYKRKSFRQSNNDLNTIIDK